MSDDGFHPFHARCQLSAECTVALLSPRKCDVGEAKEMSDGFLLVADTGKGECLWNGFVDKHHPLSSMSAIAPSRVRMKMEGREETTVAIFDLACFLLLLLHCFRQDDYHLCKGRTQ
jgi:hypothetical protein